MNGKFLKQRLFSGLLPLAIGQTALGAGCGPISLGNGGAGIDPVPSGTVTAQGNLSGINGNTVSGFVQVFKQDCTSTCTFVLRFQGLSTSSGGAIQIVPNVNGVTPSSIPTLTLRLPSGSQNYTYSSIASGATWTSVSLHPSGIPVGQQDYGIASLQQTGN